MNVEKKSPFEPRKPVSPEKLEGRKDIINDYVKFMPLAMSGEPQHFYLYGNRGVGKSSLAYYLIEYAKVRYNMIGIHIYNDGVHSLDDLINNIVEKLLNEIKNESWAEKITKLFNEHIENVGFLGSSIKFRPQNSIVTKDIKDSFDDFIVTMINKFEDKKGLFIVIDDINGLSETSDFANWYKSFADSLATNYNKSIPLIMMLTSHPKVSRILYNHNPSFNRIFLYRKVNFLQKSEVKDFFKKRFASQNIEIDEDALNLMVEFTAGSPTMMQNIGDEVYWINNEDIISEEIVLKGIKQAKKEIELRYLQNDLNEFKITNDDLNILKVLGKDFINNAYDEYSFNIGDVTKNLSKFDEELLINFIKKAIKAGIIESKSENENEFIFTNDLYPIYFSI